MAFPRKIKNFSAFVDGFGYFGRVVTATMPDLQLNTQEYRGGGMDAPVEIDMGQQAMTASLVFAEWAPELLTHWGTNSRMVLRGGAQGEGDFEADSLVISLGGRFKGMTGADFQAGGDVTLTLEMAVTAYRLEHNGTVAIEIDVEAGRRVVGGNDQLAAMRLAMGI